MIATKWDLSHQKHTATFANYITVQWTPTVARFSETLQIVDVLDCLYLLYGSESSATNAHSKFFGKGTLANTEQKTGIQHGNLMWRVKWNDASSARNAVKISDMHKILKSVITTPPKTQELTSILNTDNLTINAACTASPAMADNNNEQTEIVPIELSKVTIAEVAKYVAPRRMEKTFNLMADATDKETLRRITVAQNQIEVTVKERDLYESNLAKRKECEEDIIDFRNKKQKEVEENQAEMQFLQNKMNSDMQLLQNKINSLQNKINSANANGLKEIAERLTQKLYKLYED